MKQPLPLLIFIVRVTAADLPDVTLQPWKITNASFYPNTSIPVFGFSDTKGFVLLYDVSGTYPTYASNDSGTTWTRLKIGEYDMRVSNYLPDNVSTYSGNGFFLGSWLEQKNFASSYVSGIVSTNIDHVKGYDKWTASSADGWMVSIQSYSTYVSRDKGATWTPYLNPFSADGVTLVSFNRIFHDGASFVAVSANGIRNYANFTGSTWRSNDGVSWHRILETNGVCSDMQGRLVVAKEGTIYDLVGDALVPAHSEFPVANGSINYLRIDGRIYAANADLLYYSDDKGVTRYRTGFPETIKAIWTSRSDEGKHIVQVLLPDNRIFSSVPVAPTRASLPGVSLESIEMRPMLTFSATSGATVIIEASDTLDGIWSEVARITGTGGTQVWNDNRTLTTAVFYRARVE